MIIFMRAGIVKPYPYVPKDKPIVKEPWNTGKSIPKVNLKCSHLPQGCKGDEWDKGKAKVTGVNNIRVNVEMEMEMEERSTGVTGTNVMMTITNMITITTITTMTATPKTTITTTPTTITTIMQL